MLVSLVAGMTIPAACGGDGPEAFAFPTVSSNELGVDPKVVSSTAPPEDTVIQVLKEGTGKPVGANDVLVADTKAQLWSTGGVELPSFVNTFSGGTAALPGDRPDGAGLGQGPARRQGRVAGSDGHPAR